MSHILHEVRERVQVLEGRQDRIQLLVDIRQGLPGPAGLPGAPGGAGILHAAGVSLGGHRVVCVRADGLLDYADNQTAEHAERAIGITVASAEAGTEASVVNFGRVDEPTWNWLADTPVFLGANGLLTQTAPVSPAVFVLRVGVPLSPTSLFVNFGSPLFITD